MSAGYAGLYSQSPEVNVSECELDDGLFKEAFKRLGVADVAAANKQSKALQAKQKAASADTDTDMKDANQSTDTELAGWSDSSRPPLFQHLQHTFTLLATVARAQVSPHSLPFTRPAYIETLLSTSWPALQVRTLKSCASGDLVQVVTFIFVDFVREVSSKPLASLYLLASNRQQCRSLWP